MVAGAVGDSGAREAVAVRVTPEAKLLIADPAEPQAVRAQQSRTIEQAAIHPAEVFLTLQPSFCRGSELLRDVPQRQLRLHVATRVLPFRQDDVAVRKRGVGDLA